MTNVTYLWTKLLPLQGVCFDDDCPQGIALGYVRGAFQAVPRATEMPNVHIIIIRRTNVWD